MREPVAREVEGVDLDLRLSNFDPTSSAGCSMRRCRACAPWVACTSMPRMTDLALWAAVCETALWPARHLRSRLRGKPQSRHREHYRSSPVAICVRSITVDRTAWTRSASDFLHLCAETAREEFPTGTGRARAGRRRRAQTFWREGRENDRGEH
jgi:hypothetical protein